MGDGLLDQHAGLDRVGRTAHHHVGQGAQHADLLGGLMGHALTAVGIACSDRDDAYIALIIGDVVTDLFDATERGEITDGIAIDNPTVHRQTGGNAGHVLFGDANIDKTVGKRVGKGFDDMVAQVTDQQEDVRMFMGFDD